MHYHDEFLNSFGFGVLYRIPEVRHLETWHKHVKFSRLVSKEASVKQPQKYENKKQSNKNIREPKKFEHGIFQYKN